MEKVVDKLKGKKINLNRGDVDNNLEKVNSFDIEKEASVDKVLKVKTRKINKPRKKGISFTQAINVAEVKKLSEQRNSKIRGKKINEKVWNEREEIIDSELENEENMSIAVILFILLVCFIVGIVLGYLLYHIAINSSNALLVVRTFFR